MIIEQFLNKKAKEIDNPIRNWGVGFTAEVINEWIDLQIQVKKLTIPAVSGCFECVVLYRETQGDKELHQSYHKGKTKDEALRDFFDTIGEKGINVLWLNNR